MYKGEGWLLKEKAQAELRERCIKNALDLIILAALKGKSMLGAYDLIGFVHRNFNITISPGTLYPKLFSLEGRGLVKTEWRASTTRLRKKVYYLTDEGKEMIDTLFDSFMEVNREIFSFLGLKTNEIATSTEKYRS